MSISKERPILFSAPMVRAILEGRKTQTRRVVKPQPEPCDHSACFENYPTEFYDMGEGEWACRTCGNGIRPTRGGAGGIRCPYGAPGDRLWLRETWQAIHVYVDPETGRGDGLMWAADIPKDSQDGFWGVAYAATDPEANAHPDDRGFSWRPSIHMPRWASRITLEITEVRVQRVAEISTMDCYAEGIQHYRDPDVPMLGSYADFDRKTVEMFRDLWDSINQSRGFGWKANPWVWCISFQRVAQNGERDRRMAGVQATHDASQEPR